MHRLVVHPAFGIQKSVASMGAAVVAVVDLSLLR
jgi:hypothetical protein|tara:strand:- start:121 stop:222 length:102 start_codon:yes stop_codon:yes gene_type:complete